VSGRPSCWLYAWAAAALGLAGPVSAGAAEPVAPAEAEPVALSEPAEPALPSSPGALEVGATLGPSIVFGEPANPEYTQSFGRVGLYVAGAVTYRTSYFIDPFLEVGYAFLASGESNLPSGPWGDGGVMEQQLGMWVISPGIRTELWRFRPQIGLGLGIARQSNDFLGETNSLSQVAVLTQLGVDFEVFSADRLRIDSGLKVAASPGNGITFVSLVVAARFDALTFGRN
jgi:hypothetical protein